MKRKGKMTAVFLLLVLVAVTGCSSRENGTVTGTNYYYPQKEAEGETQTEVSSESIKAELGSDQYMILANDMSAEQLLLRQMESGKQAVYRYSVTTKFLDKYGNPTSTGYFEPGRIVVLGTKDRDGRLKSAQISEEVWEYEEVVRYEIQEERGVFTIAGTKYSFDQNVFVVSAGEKITLSDIQKEDELRIIGKNKQILSVAVTTGQGRIALKNTELFEGSFIQIGNKIFAEITGETELSVPEGVYTVTVANNGWGGSAEYEVRRSEVTEIDLEELKGEGPKMGMITFRINTADENEEAEISFRVDGKEADYEEPVALAYGIHTITARSAGYETYSKKLFVNSETAVIWIALDSEVSDSAGVSTDIDTVDEEEDGENTNLAGSLAGSLSGSTSQTEGTNTADNQNTDELTEILKNALSDGSSADYLSTLTELLGNIIN